MKLKTLAAATLVALSAASAQAGTWAWNAHDPLEHELQLGVAPGPIGDLYTFSIGAQSTVVSKVLGGGILAGTYSLWSDSATDTLVGTWGYGASNTVSLAAGNYYYYVSGFSSGSATYSIASAVTAVPEPETYAMLAAGLGIVGFVASRRRRND